MAAKRKVVVRKKAPAKKATPKRKKATAKKRPKVVRKDRPKVAPKRPRVKSGHAPPGSLRPHGKMTAKVKASICADLAVHWIPATVCHAHDICLETFRRHRHDDPEFAAALEIAHEQYRDKLRNEVERRGVEGVSEAVYYKGDIVGYVQKYSDSLLTLHVRRHDKSYVEAVKVDQNTNLSGSVVGLKGELTELAPEVREQLQKLLEAQLAAKGDDADE